MSFALGAASYRRTSPIAHGVVEAGAVALLAVYAAALALALQAGVWLVAKGGEPGCFDFAEFWSAGRMAATARAAQAYDWSALAALLKAQGTHAFETTGFPFFYPPPVLLALLPLGLLSFGAAAAVWTGAGAIAWALLGRRLCAGRASRRVLLASPAVFLCLVVGQTGLLVAVLAGAALVVLPKRPILSGLLLAVLAMKPQTALLFPLALLAAARWRALAACALALAALVALSVLAFGPTVWLDWLHALHPGPGAPAPLAGLDPEKLQSVYGLLVTLGVAKVAATVVQGGVALGAAAWTAWLWRSGRPWSLKAAGLCAAALLMSPYSAVYDLPITTVALGFLLSDACRRPVGLSEGLALAFAYLLPILFLVLPFPYGPTVCVILCAVVTRRCLGETPAAPASPTSGVAAPA